MDIDRLKELYNSHAIRETEIESGKFVHLTNVDRKSFEQGHYCFTGPFIVHEPQATEAYTTEELKAFGMVGIYRQADQTVTNFDSRQFHGTIADKIREEGQRQPLTWGWHKLFGTASIREAVIEDFQKKNYKIETLPLRPRRNS